MYNQYWIDPRSNPWTVYYPVYVQQPYYFQYHNQGIRTEGEAMGVGRLEDYGPNPLVIPIEAATKVNRTFRTALWTGKHFQITLMSIAVGEDIGLEVHPTTDQFLRIEAGQGLVQMGDQKDKLDYVRQARVNDAIVVPAGKWHNVTNNGTTPLQLYVIYAPPEHAHSTVHVTKQEALASEN